MLLIQSKAAAKDLDDDLACLGVDVARKTVSASVDERVSNATAVLLAKG